MLPLPKLDDRTYEEIREEAIGHIIQHCPSWTNHNASDPGITLVELFGSMTEMMMYRINEIPKKNYIAFLDMIGIKSRYATPASCRVQFEVSEGFELDTQLKSTITVPSGFVIANEPTGDEEPILFETQNKLYLNNLKITNVLSKTYKKEIDSYITIDHSEDFKNHNSFIPFEENKKSNNFVALYLYGDEFASLKQNSFLSVLFRLPTNIDGFNLKTDENFLRKMQWQYFDGEKFNDLNILPTMTIDHIDDSDANILSVTLEGSNSDFTKAKIEDISKNEHFFIRAVLKEIPIWLKDFSLYEISVSTKSKDDGINPDSCFYRLEPLDLNSIVSPFGLKPMLDDSIKDETFYIKCDEAFCKKGARVVIDILHSNHREYIMPKAYNDLNIVWEYSTNKNSWKKLTIEDTTENFTRNGAISFEIADDFNLGEVNGEEGYWIRASIENGNYGEEEKRVFNKETGEEELISDATLQPPSLSRISIKYQLDRKDIQNCVSCNNYAYKTIKFDKHKAIKLFDQESDKETALYFAFDGYMDAEILDLYFDIEQKVIQDFNLNSNERMLSWEILKDSKFIPLDVEDTTDNLTRSGDIRFRLPKMVKLEDLEINLDRKKAMWIRAKIVLNANEVIPKINTIMTNTTVVYQQTSFHNEFIAKSIGLPDMEYELNNSNLIAPPKIKVGDDDFKLTNRFVDNSSQENVFRYDPISNKIKFGDSKFGAIPKVGSEIIAHYYATTLGKSGNIGKNKIKVLRQSISFISGVTNIEDATGGVDGDNIDDLIKIAPSYFKTRNRAITVEDYETLAKDFSSYIISAKAVNIDGEVVVIIVTQDILEQNGLVNRKFIEDLRLYLKSMSLVTVMPIVKVAKVVNIKASVKIKSAFKNEDITAKQLQDILNKEAKKYFSDIYNKDITKSDLYKILNSAMADLYFEDIKFIKDNKGVGGSKIKISYDEVIKFDSITVEDLSYE